MKRNRRAALCAVLMGLLLCGCAGKTASPEQHTVTLVAKSTQTEFWLSVFARSRGGCHRVQHEAEYHRA